MTDQEKNGRSIIQKNSILLDWAGFAYEGDKYWIYPDGTRHFHNWVGDQLMIDLYHSLDAQAKWLWPKLEDFDLTFSANGEKDGYWASVLGKKGHIDKFASTPAEVCAEAILSLIGEDG